MHSNDAIIANQNYKYMTSQQQEYNFIKLQQRLDS